jgi:hypothetical protein
MLIATVLLSVTSFTSYPAFGDETPAPPKLNPRIEAVTDKGPILEMIIKCPKGTAIISFSKIDKKYCSPHMFCDTTLGTVLAASCM